MKGCQRPFIKGKLYTHFTVEFPDSLTLDECEETTMHDVNVEAEKRRKEARAQQEAYNEDDDMAVGAQRVQCAQH